MTLGRGLRAVRLWRRLRCAVRGHRWVSQVLAGRAVVARCDRCRETVAHHFKAPSTSPAGPGSHLGNLATARAAVDVTASFLAYDDGGWVSARRALIASPDSAVDSLMLLVLHFARRGGDLAALADLRSAAVTTELQALKGPT